MLYCPAGDFFHVNQLDEVNYVNYGYSFDKQEPILSNGESISTKISQKAIVNFNEKQTPPEDKREILAISTLHNEAKTSNFTGS